MHKLGNGDFVEKEANRFWQKVSPILLVCLCDA